VTVKATRRFVNTPTGFKELEQWVKKHADASVTLVYTMEATGIYYEQIAWYLFTHAKVVSVILPNKARQYARSLGLKRKNDKIDSIGLARMGAEQNLPRWQPLSKQFYQLRTLTRELESLHQTKTALNNQLHSQSHAQLESKSTQKRLLAMIKLLDKQIESIQQEVHQLVEADSELKRKLEHITQIEGVGLMSAITVIAETNGFALIENGKQLVSYAGYDVVENQSGKRVGKTIISKKGNYRIRRILHLPSFNVVRYEGGLFKTFFDRLIDNGKKKMQAYVAVQKKLLVLIYTLWQNDIPYQPDYDLKPAFGNNEPGTSLFGSLPSRLSNISPVITA
jgi:transposase